MRLIIHNTSGGPLFGSRITMEFPEDAQFELQSASGTGEIDSVMVRSLSGEYLSAVYIPKGYRMLFYKKPTEEK